MEIDARAICGWSYRSAGSGPGFAGFRRSRRRWPEGTPRLARASATHTRETSPDDFPGFSRIRIVFEFLKPPIELSLLNLRQGDVRPLGEDAVPEIRGELDAFGNGQLAEVELRVVHAASLLHGARFRKPSLCSGRASIASSPSAAAPWFATRE